MSDGILHCLTGCFAGTEAAFLDRVATTHGASKHGQDYRAAIAFARSMLLADGKEGAK